MLFFHETSLKLSCFCCILFIKRCVLKGERKDVIMSDTYVECLVKAKATSSGKFLKILLIMLTVVFGFFGMIGFIISLVAAVITGVGAYFIHMNSDLEYEYLYVDKELSIDKIMAKTRRKKVGTYKIERMEILAPVKSYHLDNYKNRNVKAKDYSVGEELKPDKRYVMYYEGGEKIILSPSEDMVKAIRSIAPRKVFMD